MRLPSIIPVVALLCALSHTSKCLADTDIYCWTDKNGTPVYSNLAPIPPDAVKFYPPVVLLQASSSGRRTQKPETLPSATIRAESSAGEPGTDTASEPESPPDDPPQDH